MSAAAKPNLSVAASNEWPFCFKVLTVHKLFVDESYQRPLSRFLKTIIDSFDPSLVGTLMVSERPGGKYAVIDGQTRLAGLRQLGLTEVPCLVYSGLQRADEAHLFERFQTQRKSMRPFHRFRAAVVAGDPESKAIDAAARQAGFELSDVANGSTQIAAIVALEAAYRRGPEILERTLATIYLAWASRQKDGANGEIIRGLAYFFDSTPNVDDDKLVRRLSVVDPQALSRRASALREGRGHGGNSPRYMAEAIASEYRRRTPVA